MSSKFTSRKFFLATFAMISGTIALFTGFMIDTVWIGLVGTILALYGGANVIEKHNDKQ